MSTVRWSSLDFNDFPASEVAVAEALEGREKLQMKSTLAVDPVARVRCKPLQFRSLTSLGPDQIKGWLGPRVCSP